MGGFGTGFGFGLGPFGGGGFGQEFPVKLTEIWATGTLLTNFSAWRINETTGAPGTVPGAPPTTEGPFYPPNWVRAQSVAQQTLITAPIPSDILSVPIPSDIVAVPGQQNKKIGSSVNYYFDAVMRVLHKQELTVTKHPVQTGAAISDHAYLQPAQVDLEIKMSDTILAFVNGQYSGDNSKSVSAYKTFRVLQSLRVPLIVTTRLYTYSNMLITSIEAPDDVTTQYGLRCFIRLQQIIPAQITTQTVNAIQQQLSTFPISTREQDTQISYFANKVGESVLPPITQTHNVGFAPEIPPGQILSIGFAPEEASTIQNSIPGATSWSSNVITGVQH